MTKFVIYADYAMPAPVDDKLLATVDRAWDMADESFCSSPKRGTEDVLSLSFDVEAGDESEAEASARAKLGGLVHATSLSGTLVKLVGYTMEGWFEADLG